MGSDFSNFGCNEALVAIDINDKLIVKRGIRRVCSLADNQKNIAKLDSIGVCEILLNIIKVHQKDEIIIDLVYIAIITLLLNSEDIKPKFSDFESCSIIMESFKMLNHSYNCCLNGCLVLALLSNNHPDNSKTFGSLGICELILKVVDDHSSQPDVIKNLVALIATLSLDESNKSRIGELGVIQSMLKVISVVNISNDFALDILTALSRLSCNNNNNKYLIGSSGGCSIVIRMIQFFFNEPSIVKKACIAISNLCSNSSNNNNFKNVTTSIEDSSLLPAINRENPSSPKTMAPSPRQPGRKPRITKISEINQFQNNEIFGSLGICNIIVEIMKAYEDNEKIIVHSLDAVCCLVVFNSSNQIRFGEMGFSHVLITFLNRYISTQVVALLGCKIISTLALHKDNQIEIAFQYIEQIGLPQNEPIIASSGGCEIIVSVILKYIVDSAVIYEACTALFRLVINNDEITEYFGSIGANEAVLSVLKSYTFTSESIANISCCVLFHLAINITNRNKLIENDASRIVGSVIEKWPNGKTFKNAKNALEMINNRSFVKY